MFMNMGCRFSYISNYISVANEKVNHNEITHTHMRVQKKMQQTF